MGVGLAQGAYDLAYAYAQERQQFGKPIAKFQAVQFKLADMATELEAGRNLVYKAAWLKDQGRDFALAAAQAKLYTGELSNRAVNWALQIHGGYGYMDEYAISRLYRDQKILEIGEGTNEGPAHGHRAPPRPLSRHTGVTLRTRAWHRYAPRAPRPRGLAESCEELVTRAYPCLAPVRSA